MKKFANTNYFLRLFNEFIIGDAVLLLINFGPAHKLSRYVSKIHLRCGHCFVNCSLRPETK